MRSRYADYFNHDTEASDFQDEFFWNVEESEADLKETGWSTGWRRFSDLLWTVELAKP